MRVSFQGLEHHVFETWDWMMQCNIENSMGIDRSRVLNSKCWV